jgi:hypothetical protein
VALQVAAQVLPPYRTRFSKHQFTQPQLLAVLCLLRYEDWTFREAEVRLREHQELRAELQLAAVPDYTTLYRFLQRLEDDTVDRGLTETVRRLRRRRGQAHVSVAIDGTGLSHNSVSIFFLRRIEQHSRGTLRHRHWLKWLIVVDLQQQILLAQRARQGPWCDTRALPGLLDAARHRVPIRLVLFRLFPARGCRVGRRNRYTEVSDWPPTNTRRITLNYNFSGPTIRPWRRLKTLLDKTWRQSS